MQKKYLVIVGMVVNVVCAILFIASLIDYYKRWDSLKKINLDNWLASDERLLHTANYNFFPFAALVMLFSAMIIWKLRK